MLAIWLLLFGLSTDLGQPMLHRVVEVPKALRAADGFGGDVRIGDLNGDGAVDFFVFRNVDGTKPCFLGRESPLLGSRSCPSRSARGAWAGTTASRPTSARTTARRLILYDPWDHRIWIYSPAPMKPDSLEGYRGGLRQTNVRLMD